MARATAGAVDATHGVSGPRRLDARDVGWGVAWLALFLITRVLWIALRPDTASYWEESYRWMAASDWLGAPDASLSDRQADHYQGGSLVVIALARPVLALAPSLLAFKTPALLFSGTTLLLLYGLAARFFAPGAAQLAAAAYLAGPPLVAYLGVLGMGSHGESGAFSLAALWLFLELVAGRRTRGRWAAFGLVNGLGIWFCPTVALTTLACALAWLLLERLPRARELAAATSGLALGLLPWLAYNLAHGFAGLRRPLEVFGLRPLADPWLSPGPLAKLVGLFPDVLPAAWLDPAGDLAPIGLRGFVYLGFSLPVVAALVASLRRAPDALRARASAARDPERQRARLELVFHAYTFVLLSAYLVSSYAVEPGDTWSQRLFAPLGLVVTLPISIQLARWSRAGPQRHWARAGWALWLCSLAAATLTFGTRAPELASELAPRAGDPLYGVLLHRKHAPELAASLAAIRKIPDPERRESALIGLGMGLARAYEVGGTLDELAARLAPLPASERRSVRWGMLWAASNGVDALDRRSSRVRIDESLVRRLQRLRALAAYLREAPQDGPAAPGSSR